MLVLGLLGEYSFGSLTFKALEHQADGVYTPVGHDGPVYLIVERFRTNTAEDIWTMLQHLTPLEETRAYQSIFVKGEAKGKTDDIKHLLARRFGPLPQRIAAASIAQLDAWIDAILDAHSVVDMLGPERGPGPADQAGPAS